MSRNLSDDDLVHNVLLEVSRTASECMLLLQNDEVPEGSSHDVASWAEANANLASAILFALVFGDLRKRQLSSLVEKLTERYTAFIAQFDRNPSAYVATMLEAVQEYEPILRSLDEEGCEIDVRQEFHLLAETVHGPMKAFYFGRDRELASIVLAHADVIRGLVEDFAPS